MLKVKETYFGEIRYDNDGQVLSIDIDDEERVYSQSDIRQKLRPTLRSLREETGAFVSASTLALKAKSFDDGLYAAIELMAHRGVSTFRSKKDLIKQLIGKVLKESSGDSSQGLRLLAMACLIQDQNFNLPSPLKEAAIGELSFFFESFESRPLGFYYWTRELAEIYRHDKVLQKLIVDGEFSSVIGALKRDSDLRDAYLAYLNLTSRLTNPLVNCGLATAVTSPEWSPENEKVSFFPPSASHETELLKALFAGAETFDGSLIEELLKRVKSGKLSLEPGTKSGWYDWQLYALEPLACLERMPESKHLQITNKYRARLEDLFKGLYALTRETHVKQLEAAFGSGINPFLINPELRIEPLPSYYLRRAKSYAYIRRTLETIFSEAELNKVERLTPEGFSGMKLFDELIWIQRLFEGACLVACEDLGMTPLLVDSDANGPKTADAIDTFLKWSWTLNDDNDVSRDARMMVPLAADDCGQVLVWVFMGWDVVKLNVKLVSAPFSVEAIDTKSGKTQMVMQGDVRLGTSEYKAAYPVMAEVWIPAGNVMTRRDFSAFCGRFGSDRDIIAALAHPARAGA